MKPTQYSDVRDYVDWLDKHSIDPSTGDYDTFGAFKAGVQPDERGHLDDTWKLQNHITYSTDSNAAKQPGAPPAGEWIKNSNGKWDFYAAVQNIRNAGGPAKLQDYFNRVEPDSRLIFPKK